MTLTQKTVLNYCEKNELVVTGWNYFDETKKELVVVKEMPNIEDWQGTAVHVEENDKGITLVNCFYTNKNIRKSHPVLYVEINGKRKKVEI